MYARARPRRIKGFHPSRNPPQPYVLIIARFWWFVKRFFTTFLESFVVRERPAGIEPDARRLPGLPFSPLDDYSIAHWRTNVNPLFGIF